MPSKKLLVSLVFLLCAHHAWASSDFICEPDWTLNQGKYNRCSNLPVLAPGNDTRVNLKLLLVDGGFAELQIKPAKRGDWEIGYGTVPFSVDDFEKNIFVSRNKKDDTNDEGESAGYDYATRCVSNDSGKADFIDAVTRNKGLSAAERKMLIEEREKLKPTCADTRSSNKTNGPESKAKKGSSPICGQFLLYLAAAEAFYGGRYDEAGAGFTSLVAGYDPWLKESSSYMLGRTALNLSQQDAFDEFGFPQLEKVNKKVLADAETKFNTYLRDYPKGRYAASARGLLRRVYWLSNRPEKLAAEFEWQLHHPESPQHNLSLSDLALEADHKLLATAAPDQIRNPLLLATLDLSLMRPANDSPEARRLLFSDLKKQGPLFAGHEALYEYLLAAHLYYVQKDPAKALKTLSDTIPRKMAWLDFSRLVLRGMALEATKDSLGARRLWLKLLPASGRPLQGETVQLALALNYEYGNQLDAVFKQDSPIKETEIRNILLRNDASPELLRQMIQATYNSPEERRLAIYTLLYKDLIQGRYQDYLRDYRFLPGDAAKFKPSSDLDDRDKPNLALFTWTGRKTDDGYNCPSTQDIAKILAKNANDPYGLVCLGDFANANDLAPGAVSGAHAARHSSAVYDAELGAAPSHFPGKVFSRGEAYKTVIADASAAPDLKAYALYRAIQCYATSGNNHCGGDDVGKPVRKSWYQTLKTRYGKTRWAQSLKYYW
jgi:TolA-binding protein